MKQLNERIEEARETSMSGLARIPTEEFQLRNRVHRVYSLS